MVYYKHPLHREGVIIVEEIALLTAIVSLVTAIFGCVTALVTTYRVLRSRKEKNPSPSRTDKDFKKDF